MKIWQNFKKHLFYKSLSKGISKRLRSNHANPLSFSVAKSIAFIFNAEDSDFISGIVKYAEQLKKKGKVVFLLGLNIHTKALLDVGFPCLNKNNIDWVGRPFGSIVEEWFNRPVDLVVHVSARSDEPLEYITALTPAGLRIGPVTAQTSCYDLMLDIPADTTPRLFFNQMENLLGIIQVRNEPSVL
jgi:hypothetical protein